MQHDLPFSGETGLTVEVMSWGATMTKLVTEDGVDILLGFDDFKGKEVFQQTVP
jgi:galactose mutarotase-like enzyme